MFYVRFVVGDEGESHRDQTGIFTEARILRDEGGFEPYEVELLEDTYAWFNEHLPCPPFSSNNWGRTSASWFKDSAQVFVDRMWDIVAILREHGIPVRKRRSQHPGKRLYEDEFQVVVDEWKNL
jgi:hypothetical protein